MSKNLEQLSKNLAGGMPRRKALWQFVTGLGAIAALTGSTAKADDDREDGHCGDFCAQQAEIFKHLCMQASQACRPGTCADLSIISINGAGVHFNGTGPFICVPVSKH